MFAHLSGGAVQIGLASCRGARKLMLMRLTNSICATLTAISFVLPASAQDITVFAAASLGGALEAVGDAWEAETGGSLTVVAAGSSAIALQVQQGAPADVVILASTDWMDTLAASGDILTDSRFDVMANALVLIGPAGAPPIALGAIPETLGDGRLAMALVDAVPAGIYGRTALENLGLWDAVAPQVVQADNVRAALAFVATGAADLGLVYATDAQAEPRVSVLASIPGDSHPPITYPAAAVTHGHIPDALAFLRFLTTQDAQAIFADSGFLAVELPR